MLTKMKKAIMIMFLVTVIVTIICTRSYIIEGPSLFPGGLVLLAQIYMLLVSEIFIIAVTLYLDKMDFEDIEWRYSHIKELIKELEQISFDENNEYYDVCRRKIIWDAEDFLEECVTYRNGSDYKKRKVQEMYEEIKELEEKQK